MEKTAEQRHRELVAATILAGILANEKLVGYALHIDERGHQLVNQANRLTTMICGPEHQD